MRIKYSALINLQSKGFDNSTNKLAVERAMDRTIRMER